MKKVKFLEFILLSGLLVGAIVLSLMNQTSASAKTDNGYQYSNVIFGFKNKKSKDIPTYKMSETFKIADVEYTIHSKEVVQNVGGEFGMNAKGSYLILNVTVKNNGTKAITVSDSDFKLVKDKTEYEPDSTAGIYAKSRRKLFAIFKIRRKNIFFTSVNPENEVTGNVVFDLNPDTISDTNLKLKINAGFGNSNKAIVTINE